MDEETPGTGGHRRRPWVLPLALILVIGGGLAATRRELAESLIESQLRALGLENVAHKVESVGFSRIEVRDVRIGSDDDFIIDEIGLRFSIPNLRLGRADALTVRGVRVRGRIDDEGLSLGALDSLLADRAESEPGSPPSLDFPVNEVSVEDATISLETADGAIDTTGSLDAHISDDGIVVVDFDFATTSPRFEAVSPVEVTGNATSAESRIEFDFSAAHGERELTLSGMGHHDLASGSGEIRFDSEPLEFREGGLQPFALLPQLQGLIEIAAGSLEADGGIRWNANGDFRSDGHLALREIDLTTEYGRFEHLNGTIRAGGAPSGSLPFSDASIEDFSFSFPTDDGSVDVTASLAAHASENSTVDLDFTLAASVPQISRNSPLGVTGNATAADGAINFEFRVVDSKQELKLSGVGHHDLATESGEMRFDSDPVTFREGGLQPSALVPQLVGLIETATGSVEANGSIRWNAEGEIQSGADLALRELNVISVDGSIENLNAAIRVDGPWPPSTPAKQWVSMAVVDFGLQLQNGLIAFQLRRDGLLDISSAEWTLAGGKVRTRGRIDPSASVQLLVLDLVDIELSELLELVDLEGLSGSGRLQGRIPLKRRGTTVEIKEGVLSAEEAGGWIRYRPDTGIAGVASQDDGFNVVLAALRNFQFRELSATVDGDTEGPVNVAIHLAGANPDYLSGHPVEFNLNVEARLVDLLRNATAVYQIPQKIEDRLTEISEGRR